MQKLPCDSHDGLVSGSEDGSSVGGWDLEDNEAFHTRNEVYQ